MWIKKVYERNIFKPLYVANDSTEGESEPSEPQEHGESETDDQDEPEHPESDEEYRIPMQECPEPGRQFAYGCYSRPVAIFNNAAPFVFTSMVSWPIFWLWRGLDWKNKHTKDVLPFYIKNTYIQAKMIQIGLIAMGIGASLDLAFFKRKSKIKKIESTNENDENGELQANVL